MVSKMESNGIGRLMHGVFKAAGIGLFAVLSLRGQTLELKVAAVQFRSSLNLNDNQRRISEILGQLASAHVQVAVFPECALTGYDTDSAPPASEKEIAAAEENIGKICRDKKIAVVLGTVYKVNSHAYDAADVFNSRGERVERYGKIHLAGEKWAVPGNHIAYFDLEGVPSTVLICHDERYPELVRLPALEGAQVVYYVSSESSLKEESKLAPYRAQMMARAVENSVFVVAANTPANHDLTGSHGQSRIIAQDGNILQEASIFGDDVLIATLKLAPAKSGWPQKSLQGPLGDWWRSGVAAMMANRHKQLE